MYFTNEIHFKFIIWNAVPRYGNIFLILIMKMKHLFHENACTLKLKCERHLENFEKWYSAHHNWYGKEAWAAT